MREDAVAESELEAANYFVEDGVGLLGIFGPFAEMNLNLAGRGKQGGVHVLVADVDGTDAFFDVRLAKAGDAEFAMKHADAGGAALQAWQNLLNEQRLQLSRRAGE